MSTFVLAVKIAREKEKKRRNTNDVMHAYCVVVELVGTRWCVQISKDAHFSLSLPHTHTLVY